MSTDPWVLMPVLAHPTYTEAAISDVLAQTVPCRLLVINQGVDTAFRRRLEALAEDSDRLLLWSHVPPLLSLAATWNRALDFAWHCGASEALVVNNDVRLPPNLLEQLHQVMGHSEALVVTGVGVDADQFTPGAPVPEVLLTPRGYDDCAWPIRWGGPDFSCFVISRSGHQRFRFDEGFIPAYCEDIDLHRRLLLAGEGRRIFSVDVPYLHYRSTTLKSIAEKQRHAIERLTATVSRMHYSAKWGGAVNRETYRTPFDPASAGEQATTPELFAEVQRGQDDRRDHQAADRPADRDVVGRLPIE